MRLAVPIALLLAVAGCAHRSSSTSTSAPTPASAPAGAVARAFVYGVVEVPAAIGPAVCVAVIEAERVRPAGARHGCVPATADGLFWVPDVAPIRWVVDGVWAGGALRRFAKAAPFAVAPGALHDWGTFRVELSGTEMVRLVPASRPTRAEVLRRLLAQDGVAPRWKERISAHLAAAGK